jgi:hypothetical protein
MELLLIRQAFPGVQSAAPNQFPMRAPHNTPPVCSGIAAHISALPLPTPKTGLS